MSLYKAEFLFGYQLYSVRKNDEKMPCLNIRSAIMKVLPDIAVSVLDILVETLQLLGIDFSFIQEADLLCRCSLSTTSTYWIAATDWVDNFQIPFNKFPEGLLQCLERGKRPSLRLRREMVRIVATGIMNVRTSPSIKASTVVAKKTYCKIPTVTARCYSR